MTAMALQFAYIMNRKLQPDSNVLRIHILHVMKPHLHDGTVMLARYRQVQVGRIPPSSREPLDVRLTRIW